MLSGVDAQVSCPLVERSGVSRTRVLLADDNGGYRRELIDAVESSALLELVGAVGDGEHALELIEELEPDVAVVDLRMPGLNGIEVCSRASAAGSQTRVLVLTAYVDGALIGRARNVGAAGYLGKETSMRDICEAVSRVGHGGTAFASAW
jgi:two-component system nitrate/nitrite response regulator NarL